MFDEIICLESVTDLLIKDLTKGALSNSMLFHGAESSAKLTAALELARLLNCETPENSNCRCANCRSFETLDFQGLVFLSRRDFTNLYITLNNLYEQTKEKKFYNEMVKVLRLIRLSLNDSFISDTFSDTDKKTINSNITLLLELIDDNAIFEKKEDVLKALLSLQSLYKKKNIPVNSVRAVLDWTFIKQSNINRVVIIDHVDHLDESSSNILLKRLEEPSKSLFFILLAENRNKVIQTIVSRCRCYYFNDLSLNNVKTVLKTKFSCEDDYESINDFINRDDPLYRKNIVTDALKILNCVFNPVHTVTELHDLLSEYNDKKVSVALLNEMSHIIESEILKRESGEVQTIKGLSLLSYSELGSLNQLITEQSSKIQLYSNNPLLTMEGIFYPIKTEVSNG